MHRTSRWLLALLVVTLLAGAWLAFRARQAEQHLATARRELAVVQVTAEPAAAKAALADAARQTRVARHATRDPLWSAVSRLPYLGAPLRSAAAISEITDTLVRRTLPPVADAATAVSADRSAGHPLPIAQLTTLRAPLATADGSIGAYRYALRHLPRGLRVGAVDRARSDLDRELARIAGPVHTAAVAAAIGPAMVGQNEARRYFVAFENRAELRPDGGLIGGFGEITFVGGKLHVVRIGPNSDLPHLSGVPGGVDPRFLAAYGNRGAGESWINTNLSPNFPDDAAAWAAMYQAGTGRHVDGVIALDPFALGAIAGLSGQPVTITGHAPVPAAQLADFIERQEYELPGSRDARKSLVAEVGRQTLSRLQSQQVPTRTALRVLGELAGAAHLRLASTHPEEQTALLQFPVAGVSAGRASPYAGTFVSNAGGTKLDAYLHEKVAYTPPPCGRGGRAELVVALRNAAPTGLPPFVTIRADRPSPAVPAGQNRLGLTAVASRGARLVSASLDGRDVRPALEEAVVNGNPAWRVYFEIPVGVQRTLRLELDEPASDGRARIQTQPLINPPTTTLSGGCR